MSASDMQFRTQIDMQIEPSNPTNVVTLGHLDAEVSNVVRFDGDRNVTFPAGMKIRVSIPATDDREEIIKDVLATDASGNILLGEDDEQVNIIAIQRPTITNGSGVPDTIVVTGDLEPYALDADVVNLLAYKADLVSGVVPDAQLPSDVKVNNWTVATASDLTTITAATVNDRAFVGTADPYDTYYLVALPPTNSANWRQAGGGGGGTAGVVSINGLTGPAVTIDLENLPNTQNALDDKANSSDLARYAPLNSPALTGSPTAPNPPANATGQQIMTAAAVNTKMGNYLPLTGGTITGHLFNSSGLLYLYNTSGATNSIYFGSGAPQSTFYSSTDGSIAFSQPANTQWGVSIGGALVMQVNEFYKNIRFSRPVDLLNGGVSTTPSAGDNSKNIATTAFVNRDFLKLSGGTLTGNITFNPLGTTGIQWGSDQIYHAIRAVSNTELRYTASGNGGVHTWYLGTGFLGSWSQGGLNVVGTITTPTRPAGTNDTTVATTEFVNTKSSGYLPLTGGTITGSITTQTLLLSPSSLGIPSGGISRINNDLVIGKTNGGRIIISEYGAEIISIESVGTQPTVEIDIPTNRDALLTAQNGYYWRATTPPQSDNSTAIATTAFVQTAVSTKANIASPALTGTPTAPTATAGTSTTQIATTAFVQNAINAIPTPSTLRRTTGTLTTTGWSGSAAPWTQTVTISNTQNGNSGLAVPCTVAQYNEYRNCGLVVTERTDTAITWSAVDKKPTIAIPVEYVGV